MRVGFLGSQKRIEYIKEVVETLFTDLTAVYIIDERAYFSEEMAERLRAIKSELSGFVFAGELQYEFYNNIFFPEIPCDYVQKDWSSLQNGLLAVALKGIDFRCVSIDSYASASVESLLSNLNVPREANHIKVLERRPFQREYVEHLFMEHRALYEQKAVKACVTAIHPVYDLLEAEGIPSVYLRPTTEVIIRTTHKVVESFESRHNKDGPIAILIIRVIPKKAYSYIRKDEYLYMHEKLKVAEEVYYFAKNTNAAVVSETADQFTVLMNKNDFLEYTGGLQRFYLLNAIYNNTNCDVNMGIGYGYDPRQAKFNASIAIERFDETQKNLTYIVPREHALIGPLDFLISEQSTVERLEEGTVFDMSRETGISQTSIYRLYAVMEKQHKNSFTSQEVSRYMEISQRNASRLLRRLEDHGRAFIVGKQLTGNSGRPSDIYEIRLNRL